MRVLWHPTRAQILELLKRRRTRQSELAKAVGAPLAAVAYHCRALLDSGCIRYAEGSGPDSDDPLFEAV
jgi:predicted transcriptional regulator